MKMHRTTSPKRFWTRLVGWVLIFCLAAPPGFMAQAAAANRRINAVTRDSKMETFRNPQFSSGASNRFLMTHSPRVLIGGGGDSLSRPEGRGYANRAEPEVLWLTNKGRLEWTETDLALPGVGLPLVFERIYRGSVSSYDGPLGKGWELSWNRRVEEVGDDAVFWDRGRKETYTKNGSNYDSPVGRYDTMVKVTTPNNEFRRTDKYGILEYYNQEPGEGDEEWFRLRKVEDLNGNRLSLVYDSNSLLTKVTDTLDQVNLLYYDANDRITKITDHASRDWTYAYHSDGYLTKVTTPAVDETGTAHDFTSGKSTTYKYDASGLLTEALRHEDSSAGTWKWEYDTGGEITKAYRGGDAMTISYDTTNRIVTVTDRESVATRYTYDTNDLIITREVFYNATDSWDTIWSYNSDAEVTEVVFPLGNRVAYTYDSDGNIVTLKFKKDASDSDPIQWVYTYTSNARLDTLKDPNGNTWDWDYDSDSNLTKKKAPAVTSPSGIATADKNGNSIYDGTIEETWTVNGSGQVTGYTDPTGMDTAYAYSTVNSNSAYLTKITRDNGTGTLNLITSYAYDGMGNVTSITDPESNVTTMLVNDLNQVLETYEPLSVTRIRYFDGNNRVTKTTATNDSDVGDTLFTVNNSYDQVDNLTKVIADVDATGTRLTTSYAYDKNDRLTKITSPEANETVYAYDQRDLRTEVTRKAASAANDAITTTTYDGNGNRVTVDDPLGYDTIFEYDGYDRLTKVKRPELNYRTMAYDKNGNVTKVSRYNSANTKLAEMTYLFDQANRRYESQELAKKADLSTNIGDGIKNDTVWRDELGRTIEHSGDICGCSNYVHVYDAVGRQVSTKDPMGGTDATRNLVITEYDKNGNVTKRTIKDRTQDSGIEADKDIETTFVYDARDRQISRKEKLDGSTDMITVYHYGKRDQVTKVVDGNGDEVRSEYNEQLWRTKETLENGSADVVTEYTYDDDGLLVTYRAKNSTTGDQDTITTYDKLDRVVTTKWPDLELTIQTYDKASNRISTTDPNGSVIVCAYDKNNRLTAKDMTLDSVAGGIDEIDYGYDGMDRLTSADTKEGVAYDTTVERTYNTLSLIETEKQVHDGYASGAGRTFTYVWDVEGQKSGVTYPTANSYVSYTRDALDRVDKISRGGTEVVDYTFSGKRVLKKAFPGSHALYTYDGYGRVTEIHHKDTSSGNTLAKFTYGWDKSHQVTYLDKVFYDDVENTRLLDDTSDEGDQYGYDGAKRLVTVLRGVPTAKITETIATNVTNNDYQELIDYQYDPTGNRTTRQLDDADDETYAYNKVNEMTSEGAGTWGYDKNGNGVSRTNQTFDYAFNNQLARHDFDDGFVATWHEYHYDAFGRLVEREHYSGTSVRFYWDGNQVAEQNRWTSSTESARKLFIWGETIDELIEYLDVNADPDARYYNHADMLGSVMVLADEGGAIEESYRYKEFGETVIVDDTFTKTSSNSSPAGNPYRYTCRRIDIQIGSYGDDWYDYRARAYRPDVGRFGQRDPLGYGDGASLYVYVANSPASFSDPFGLAGPYAKPPAQDKPPDKKQPTIDVGLWGAEEQIQPPGGGGDDDDDDPPDPCADGCPETKAEADAIAADADSSFCLADPVLDSWFHGGICFRMPGCPPGSNSGIQCCYAPADADNAGELIEETTDDFSPVDGKDSETGICEYGLGSVVNHMLPFGPAAPDPVYPPFTSGPAYWNPPPGSAADLPGIVPRGMYVP